MTLDTWKMLYGSISQTMISFVYLSDVQAASPTLEWSSEIRAHSCPIFRVKGVLMNDHDYQSNKAFQMEN